MILILVPLAGLALGLGLWAALRGVGALDVPGAAPASSRQGAAAAWRDRERRDAPGSLGERIDQVPRGCLFAVIAAAVLWIVAWLVLLVVGLSLLS